MAGPISRGKALGDAILNFLASGWAGHEPIPSALSLKEFGWARWMNNLSSSYPSNPYLQCPRLVLRMLTQDLSPGPPQGGKIHEATYKYTLFYHRQQSTGISKLEQENMVNDMEIISNAFTQFFIQVPDIEAVTGWQSFSNYPEQMVIHDEIRHKWKDPKMTVSVGEITYNVIGRINSNI